MSDQEVNQDISCQQQSLICSIGMGLLDIFDAALGFNAYEFILRSLNIFRKGHTLVKHV